MRKQFSQIIHSKMSTNQNIVVLTGDLGYGLWDKIRLDYPDRFFNVGSAEQLMIGMAVGMTLEGKIPLVYSITPFLLCRPYEFIRNYLDHERIQVKLVGGGRDRDYGALGFSHWAEDDQKIMSCFQNIIHYRPAAEEDLESIVDDLIYNGSPSYINLRK